MIFRLEFHLPKAAKRTTGRCMGCGCTDAAACDEGCAWVDASHLLCTGCVGRALDAIDPRRPTEVSRVHDRESEFTAVVLRLKQPKPRKRSQKGKS